MADERKDEPVAPAAQGSGSEPPRAAGLNPSDRPAAGPLAQEPTEGEEDAASLVRTELENASYR